MEHLQNGWCLCEISSNSGKGQDKASLLHLQPGQPSLTGKAKASWSLPSSSMPSVPLEDAFSGYPCYLRGKKKKICLHNKVDSEGKGSDSHHSCCSSFTPQWFSLLQTLSLKQAINKSLGGNAPTQHIKSTISPSTEWHSTVVVSYVMIFPLPRHLWVFSKIVCYIILGAG